MIRIYADSNERDEEGRFLLNIAGSRRDIQLLPTAPLVGQTVLLYMTGEFEVIGTLEFDEIWKATPDWTTIRHYD